MVRRATVLSLPLLLAACTVGPDFRRPAAPVAAAWKEAGPADGWKTAQPRDDATRGKWWEIFGDPALDALEEQVTVSNQNIAQAEAQYQGARAAARGARADLFPSVGASASAGRAQGGAGRSSTVPGQAAPTVTSYQLLGDVSWEVDIFGRTRRNVESSVESAQSAAAQVEAVRLAAQAQLAASYFALHGLDAQRQLLDSTVEGYQTALELTKNRYNQGIVSGIDVAQAETQLETTRAQATDLGIARAQLEHSIAILLGTAPADFSIGPEPIHVEPPAIPILIPSELLERRPDIASAERRVAAANALVGVAQAAFFPSLALAASGGYQSSALASFFSLPNRFWSLGPALVATLFDAGKRHAGKEQALASWDSSVAFYRQTVLGALQEVEDNLVAVRILREEARQQAVAVAAAERSLTLAKNRYKAGITTYLEVVTAQSIALANERTAVDLKTRLMTASVNLVKALGGGWRAADLPSPEAVVFRHREEKKSSAD